MLTIVIFHAYSTSTPILQNNKYTFEKIKHVIPLFHDSSIYWFQTQSVQSISLTSSHPTSYYQTLVNPWKQNTLKNTLYRNTQNVIFRITPPYISLSYIINTEIIDNKKTQEFSTNIWLIKSHIPLISHSNKALLKNSNIRF